MLRRLVYIMSQNQYKKHIYGGDSNSGFEEDTLNISQDGWGASAHGRDPACRYFLDLFKDQTEIYQGEPTHLSTRRSLSR